MDLLSISALDDATLARLLEEGARWARCNRDRGDTGSPLGGRLVVNAFFEHSTRTALSFEIAAKRLGAHVVALQPGQSSLAKGETYEDTIRTLDAMRPDAIVIRHRENLAPHRAADLARAGILNAGDGTNEHPTQALLDALVLQTHFGRIEGLKVAICGDIRHSRVARSNALLLARLGAEVRLAGPPELLPDDLAVCGSVDEALDGADAVMMLRVQRERLEEDLHDAPGEYLARYGLTEGRLAGANPDAVVLHPGPMNRGVEIDDAVADDPRRSLILMQVEMGVAMRMACLDLVVGN